MEEPEGIKPSMTYIENQLHQLALCEAGDDLEYDPQFLALVVAIEGGEEVQYGEQVYQPPETDWRWVAEQCEQLLMRGLDLRAAVYQCYAWLMRDGFAGFLSGLQVIQFLVDQRWENLHPQLLEEDCYDPLIRLNALAYLAAPATAAAQLKRLPLTDIGGGLCFSPLDDAPGVAVDEELREACIARLQRITGPDEVGEFQCSVEALQQILDVVRHIHAALIERIGIVAGLPLQGLEQMLQRMLARLLPFVKVKPQVAAAELLPNDDRKTNSSLALSGECSNRAEVIQALDAVCHYYHSHEPNSPVPLLIARAMKLVDMNFLQIISELTPESITGIKNLAGLTTIDD